MKKIAISSLVITAAALLGCDMTNSTTASNSSVSGTDYTISAQTLDSAVTSNENVQVTDPTGKVLFEGKTDSLGHLECHFKADSTQLPFTVHIGPDQKVEIRGDRFKQHRADFVHQKAPFRPDSAVVAACGLPKLSDSVKAEIKSYVEQHQAIPVGLLPVLNETQKSCLDSARAAHLPQRSGGIDPLELGKICLLPKPDSLTQVKIDSLVRAHLPVPRELLPVLDQTQQACVDSVRSVNGPIDGKLPLLGGIDPKTLGAICKLPVPDSTTKAQIDSYIQAHQPVPQELLPRLDVTQQACVDSVFKANAPQIQK